jgi:hypothetical protein
MIPATRTAVGLQHGGCRERAHNPNALAKHHTARSGPAPVRTRRPPTSLRAISTSTSFRVGIHAATKESGDGAKSPFSRQSRVGRAVSTYLVFPEAFLPWIWSLPRRPYRGDLQSFILFMRADVPVPHPSHPPAAISSLSTGRRLRLLPGLLGSNHNFRTSRQKLLAAGLPVGPVPNL